MVEDNISISNDNVGSDVEKEAMTATLSEKTIQTLASQELSACQL